MIMKKAAVYLRVSTEEQRERQSIETQRGFAERYVVAEKLIHAGEYADDGVSGTIPLDQRPHGARLLADARARKFDTVLVYKLDRIGRDPRLILNAVQEIQDLGITVQSLTEPFETSTASGRFMLTILSGVAGLERDNILQRSAEGIKRLVGEGAWVGGVVPFGYRVEGAHRQARLAVSEVSIPGTGMTEADVIRLMYRMAGDEGKSCQAIADRLTHLGVPPACARVNGNPARGQRQRMTAGIWRDSRIHYVLRSSTYRGAHQYGKNPKNPNRKPTIVEREVPAIVSQDLWERTQLALTRNKFMSKRNAHHNYLLRGLVKCAHCGYSYIGTVYTGTNRRDRRVYVCGGRHKGRRVCPDPALRCRGASVGGELEQMVWEDVEQFLRSPGEVLAALKDRLEAVNAGVATTQTQLDALRTRLDGMEEERNRVIRLFRRGGIDDADLDRQVEEITRERVALAEEIKRLENEDGRSRLVESQILSAAHLLTELNQRLGRPLTWELKRQLVETLVEAIRVETIGEGKARDNSVQITYRFGCPDLQLPITRTGE
jgi:site-specific DNA recombinase